ncbi:MAG: lipase family alpha/beta hydrolase [Luteimonas sp.]
MTRPASTRQHRRDDLRGLNQLAIDAVTGATDLVEAIHAAITHLPAVIGRRAPQRTAGLPSWIYGIIRSTTRVVGSGIDTSLSALAPWLGTAGSSHDRDGVIAALNGVLGDHLETTGNPLATTMAFHHHARALTLTKKALRAAFPDAGATVVVLLHGLCMNDRQWNFRGHDHGAALARDLGITPVYLRYNSGRHVSRNGDDFTVLMQQLLSAWPLPVTRLVLVGHSMGGLVARSACLSAARAGHAWLDRLTDIVFLGTPHHGAPLERMGSWVDRLIGLSPYSAPLVRLGRLRSAGIRDLRHGNARHEDCRRDTDPGHVDARMPLPLPKGVRCHAIATTTLSVDACGDREPLRGDGLVPIDSALGRHPDRAFDLRIPKPRQWIGYDTNHLEQLGSIPVYEQIRRSIAKPAHRAAQRRSQAVNTKRGRD